MQDLKKRIVYFLAIRKYSKLNDLFII